MPELVPVSDPNAAALAGGGFDAVVLVTPHGEGLSPEPLRQAVEDAAKVDANLWHGTRLHPVPALAGGRLVIAHTGRLDRDYDDARRYADAAAKGLHRARSAGAVEPLLLFAGIPEDSKYAQALPVGLLGAVGGLWQPLEAREALGADTVEPIQRIGCAVLGSGDPAIATDWVSKVDPGMRLAKDLCGTEPERMAPPRFAELCEQAFKDLPVTVSVLAEQPKIENDYPLLAAVARCSQVVERHRPRIIRLEYEGQGPITRTLLFAGKGLVYDTGGADIKADGAMAGMSRDKGGAAAVAGFVHAVASLGLPGVKVIAEIGAVRNSVGADAFVSDEIIKAHCGTRVRIGNTDAEGRLVLADLLSHLREDAKGATSPQMFSVATLTGHAAKALGPYTAVVENQPARDAKIADRMSALGDLYGDPCDVSRLRREDFDFVRPRTKADDVLSCNNAPSSATPRGHQFPAAFLAIASGLDDHGASSDQPIAYAHIDVAGSATEGDSWQHGNPSGRPIAAMLAALVEGGVPS